MDKGIASSVQACVQGSAPYAEDHDVAWQGSVLAHTMTCAQLILCDAGNLDAILAIGPVNEPGAIKALPGRGPANAVGLAHLRVGCAHCALSLGRDISWRHVVESTATGKQAQDGEDTDEGYRKTLHGGLLQTECFCSPYRPIPKKVYPSRLSF